jgi:diacylglycerol kinase (ATP)
LDQQKKLFVVLNPVAGLINPAITSRLISHWCERHGWDYQIYLTSEGEDLSRPVKKAVEGGSQAIVAVGGDGTISAVASSLVNCPVPLLILPLGTGNLLARDLGIPFDLIRALNVIERENSVLKLDVMEINGRFCVLNAGVGFSSQLIKNTNREEKRRFGFLAYIKGAVLALIGLQPHRFRLTVDGKKINIKASEIYVANGGLLGVKIPLEGINLLPDDGWVDLFVIKARTLKDYLEILYYILRRKPRQAPKMFYTQGSDTIQIECETTVPVQSDGEVICETPVLIKIIPNAVRVLVPAKQNDPLMAVLRQIVGL